MTDAGRPVSCCADRDIADLPVGGQVTEQYEIPDAALKRLLMQFCAEDLHVKLRAHGSVRNDDVEMLETEILQRKRRLRGRLSPRRRR
jgi:hypothetical protein